MITRPAGFFAFLLNFFVSATFAQKQMNVVFLLSDDQRYNTVHALGNEEISTPNLDRLVRMGTAFTRAHVMGGRQGAICMPSRVMMLTGVLDNHLTNDGAIIPASTPGFPELLHTKGYITFHSGKWHSDKARLEKIVPVRNLQVPHTAESEIVAGARRFSLAAAPCPVADTIIVTA